MSDDTRFLLFGLAIPAAMGLIVGAAGLMGARPPAAPQEGPTPAPGRLLFHIITALVLALAAGALTLAQYGVVGGTQWPPVAAADRFRLVPAALLALCILVMLAGVKPGARGWLIALGGGGLGAAIVGRTASGLPSTLIIAAIAAWSLVSTAALLKLQADNRRVAPAVVLVGLGLAVGAALIGTGSIELGKHGFAVAAILAGIAIASLAMRGPIRPMTLGMMSAALATLLAYGVLFSSTPWWVVATLAAVTPAAFAAHYFASKRAGPKTATALAIAAAAIIAAVAVAPGIKSLADFILGNSTPTY